MLPNVCLGTLLRGRIGKRFVPESKSARIALVGESSGAHLAALYLARIKCEGRRSGNDGRPRPDLAACVLISGAYGTSTSSLMGPDRCTRW